MDLDYIDHPDDTGQTGTLGGASENYLRNQDFCHYLFSIVEQLYDFHCFIRKNQICLGKMLQSETQDHWKPFRFQWERAGSRVRNALYSVPWVKIGHTYTEMIIFTIDQLFKTLVRGMIFQAPRWIEELESVAESLVRKCMLMKPQSPQEDSVTDRDSDLDEKQWCHLYESVTISVCGHMETLYPVWQRYKFNVQEHYTQFHSDLTFDKLEQLQIVALKKLEELFQLTHTNGVHRWQMYEYTSPPVRYSGPSDNPVYQSILTQEVHAKIVESFSLLRDIQTDCRTPDMFCKQVLCNVRESFSKLMANVWSHQVNQMNARISKSRSYAPMNLRDLQAIRNQLVGAVENQYQTYLQSPDYMFVSTQSGGGGRAQSHNDVRSGARRTKSRRRTRNGSGRGRT